MSSVPTRRAASAALALAALAAASLPAAAGAADPPRLIKAHRVTGVACVPAAANTVRADVRVFMSVVNYHGWADWADHMEAKARLESAAPGLNLHSSWKKWKTPYLIQDKRHAYNIRLVTDNKSGTADWRVHVTLIWHRPAPVPNVTKDVYLPFNESCAPQTGGGGGGGGGGAIPLPAAPAVPSVGGG
ncbi:MAG: hypothetical protein AB7O78_12060 [Thermoleophilia bacterium]